jgi:integrase/recombinase XerD
MNPKSNVIEFPRHQPKRHKARPTSDGPKFFTQQQIMALRRRAKDAAELARHKGAVTAVREWLLIDLLTCTGVRAAEAADIRCGDIRAAYGQCALFIRNGKGGRARTIEIPDSLKRHLKSFLAWKQEQGEPTAQDDPLFVGQRGPWKASAVQQAVKKHLRELGIYERGKAAHSLRHSYATELYRREHDIRTVQRQLGHASVYTTQIYADVTPEDIQRQVKGLWGGERR